MRLSKSVWKSTLSTVICKQRDFAVHPTVFSVALKSSPGATVHMVSTGGISF